MNGYAIRIKPLSVNKVWQGKRFKTNDYKQYEKAVSLLLPPSLEIPEGNLRLDLEWGFSSKASDFDNPVKPFTDILQKKYGFNDSRIYESHIKKVDVKKGAEYIIFNISAI